MSQTTPIIITVICSTRKEEWRAYFGTQWKAFRQRKLIYGPSAIFAPGQVIIQKQQLPYEFRVRELLNLLLVYICLLGNM